MRKKSPLTSIETRRQFLIAASATFLSACSSSGSLGIVRDTVALSLASNDTYPRTRAQIDALPYAQLGLRIGNGPRSILVLSESVNDDLHWVSSNRVLLVTRAGRLVRTVGLQRDIQYTLFLSPDFLAAYKPDDSSWLNRPTLRSVDVVPGDSFQIALRSKIQLIGPETITIAEQVTETLKVEETVSSEAWNWEAKNTYWLSLRSGLVWRSIQNVGPGQDPVEIELLKRPT